ncbi:hypothetical protein [Archangium sp.]|uniref:hypothetical protein n=1 Tax=Archangium sp. TaxID=1872627 RepID=UPI002D2355D0|nr:hypothetical protein [Archangium sp.]HYO55165.1 hypothetical protein [Archangium sp.]
MKNTPLRLLLPAATLFIAAPASAAGWFVCGDLSQIGWSCQLSSYPSTQYEYGIAFNTSEPHVVTCSYWNYGMRIYNRFPYMMWSDNPQAGARWGGFLFYTGTLATDDDTCGVGTWRHQYWHLDPNNTFAQLLSNGCHGSAIPIYCRAR